MKEQKGTKGTKEQKGTRRKKRLSPSPSPLSTPHGTSSKPTRQSRPGMPPGDGSRWLPFAPALCSCPVLLSCGEDSVALLLSPCWSHHTFRTNLRSDRSHVKMKIQLGARCAQDVLKSWYMPSFFLDFLPLLPPSAPYTKVMCFY